MDIFKSICHMAIFNTLYRCSNVWCNIMKTFRVGSKQGEKFYYPLDFASIWSFFANWFEYLGGHSLHIRHRNHVHCSGGAVDRRVSTRRTRCFGRTRTWVESLVGIRKLKIHGLFMLCVLQETSQKLHQFPNIVVHFLHANRLINGRYISLM